MSLETQNDDDTCGTLSVKYPKLEKALKFNLFWLRDHCKCEKCYNYETFQKCINILDLPLDIKTLETTIDDGKLYVIWKDGHNSEYDLDYLYKSQQNYDKSVTTNDYLETCLWDKNKIQKEPYAQVQFGSFLSDDSQAVTVVSSIVKYGFAFIKKVPPTTDMTEMTIKRLFPIHKTLFGEMWTFTSNNDRADTAYTTKYLGPHTDNTYFCDASGLQVFHCIKSATTGGNSFFVDGFNAVEELQLNDPDTVNVLSEVNVPAEYVDKDQHHKYSAPIIQFDSITKQPKQIRFNLYDRSDFTEYLNDLNVIENFYKSLKKFTAIVSNDENIFKFKLEPGTVVIFDNWRILHGREEFSGERIMTGCYVSRTDYMSKARIFGLIK